MRIMREETYRRELELAREEGYRKASERQEYSEFQSSVWRDIREIRGQVFEGLDNLRKSLRELGISLGQDVPEEEEKSCNCKCPTGEATVNRVPVHY